MMALLLLLEDIKYFKGNISDKKNRDDRIRTCDPFVPNEVRCQAALHPDKLTLREMSRQEFFMSGCLEG